MSEKKKHNNWCQSVVYLFVKLFIMNILVSVEPTPFPVAFGNFTILCTNSANLFQHKCQRQKNKIHFKNWNFNIFFFFQIVLLLEFPLNIILKTISHISSCIAIFLLFETKFHMSFILKFIPTEQDVQCKKIIIMLQNWALDF